MNEAYEYDVALSFAGEDREYDQHWTLSGGNRSY